MSRQMSPTERTLRTHLVASAIERATVLISERAAPTANPNLKPVPSLHRFGLDRMSKIKTEQSLSNYSDTERAPRIPVRETVYSMADLGLQYKPCDDADIPERHPSYRNFHIPYDITALDRYSRKKAKYQEQFRREIQHLIDFQSSAIEASYFVRVMAYTTLWPPLHNRHELEYTSNNMFQLSPKEKSRLHYIMTHEFT